MGIFLFCALSLDSTITPCARMRVESLSETISTGGAWSLRFRSTDYVSDASSETSWALRPSSSLLPSMQKYAARPDLGFAEAKGYRPDLFRLKWWLYGGFCLSALSILLKTKSLRLYGAEGGIKPQAGVCCNAFPLIRLRPTRLRNRFVTPNKVVNGKGVKSHRGCHPFNAILRFFERSAIISIERILGTDMFGAPLVAILHPRRLGHRYT